MPIPDTAADGIAPIQHPAQSLFDTSVADSRLQLQLTETRAELMSLQSILGEKEPEWTIREMGLQEQITRLERDVGDGRRSDSHSPENCHFRVDDSVVVDHRRSIFVFIRPRLLPWHSRLKPVFFSKGSLQSRPSFSR